MNQNENTSFFDEAVEDESITLNEDELNNILEEGTPAEASLTEGFEPDVIVIEKEKLAPTLDLSGSGISDMDDALLRGAGSDELAAASELVDTAVQPSSDDTAFGQAGFDNSLGETLSDSSGITEATEISEITAFNDVSPVEEPVEISSEMPPPGVSMDEEISLTGEELEDIVSSAPVSTISTTPAAVSPLSGEGVVFSDESSASPAMDFAAEAEEIPAVSDVPETTVAEEMEFERLDADELPVSAADTLTEVEPIELETIEEESSSVEFPGVEVIDEDASPAPGTTGPLETSGNTGRAGVAASEPEIGGAGEPEISILDLSPSEEAGSGAPVMEEVALEPFFAGSTVLEETSPEPVEAAPAAASDSGRESSIYAETAEEISEAPYLERIDLEEPATPEPAMTEPTTLEPAMPADMKSSGALSDAEERSSFDDVEEIDLGPDENPAMEATILNRRAPEKTENFGMQAETKKGVKSEESSFFRESDEDEAITLNSDELNNILTNAEVEESGEMSGFGEEAAGPAAGGSTGPLSRDNLKEIFVYLDNLLDKLPEGEVKRFAESRYYDLYNQIFDELDII